MRTEEVHGLTSTAMLCFRWQHQDWVSLMSAVCMKYCVFVALVSCHVTTTSRYVITLNSQHLYMIYRSCLARSTFMT